MYACMYRCMLIQNGLGMFCCMIWYMYVCMYVCMYVYMYVDSELTGGVVLYDMVRMYVCMHVCIGVC